MLWVCIGIAALLAGLAVFLRWKGYLGADDAAAAICAVVGAVRRAEAVFDGARQAGAQKKGWVLRRLGQVLGASFPEEVLSPLIDAVVACFNAAGWGKRRPAAGAGGDEGAGTGAAEEAQE